MKIITLNANGIRSARNKGFFDWMLQQDADVVCIQEIKAQTEQLDTGNIATARVLRILQQRGKERLQRCCPVFTPGTGQGR